MRLLLLVLGISCCQIACSQGNSWISSSAAYGFFVPHRESLPQLLTGHSKGIALTYSRSVDGSDPWHHHLRGPERGLSFLYLDMGNREELGSIYTLYPYVDLPLSENPNGNGPDLRIGVGFAYLDKRYDREENFFNQAIGSHINYSIIIGLGYRYSVGRIRARGSISMTHASNATIQLPNLGVNVAAADLVLSYRLQPSYTPMVIDRSTPWQKKSVWRLGLSFGLRESNAFTHVKHPLEELRATFIKRFSPKLSYELGADIIHNKASYQELDTPVDFGLDVLQIGARAGIGLEFGRSRLFLQQGVYIADGKQDLGGLYHRVGGMMNLSDRWSLDLTLKTHFAKADYLALGIGYLLSERIKE